MFRLILSKKPATLSVILICAASLGLLTGCASIVGGTQQSISVETPAVNNASCSLINDKGKWFVNNTPGSVTVHRSYKDLVVECQKKGYLPARVNVKSTTKPMAFGNVLFGGPIGAGMDMASGAAYNYPAVIKIPLKTA